MTLVALVVCAVLIGSVLVNAVSTVWFTSQLDRARGAVAYRDLPAVAILLSLRGIDLDLADGLRCLLRQQYPHYEVHIVIDRHDDPAWEVVQQIIRETDATHVSVSPLQKRLETCSLKNSALLQLIAELDDACEVVVTANGSIQPHANWLRDLVAPLSETGVGATYGNPWFTPPASSWGGFVRYLWNASAVIFRYLFEIPWGGTFAIRRSILLDSGLVDAWAHAMVDDAPTRNVLHAQGLRIQCVPSLMMANREACSLASSLDFMMRQMTWGRMYGAGWSATIFNTIVVTGGLIMAAILVPLGLALNQLHAVAWAGAGLVGYWLVTLMTLGLLEKGVRRVMASQGQPMAPFSLSAWAKIGAAIPLAQGVHVAAFVLAACKRRITWRGVTYHIRGGIRIVSEQPVKPVT